MDAGFLELVRYGVRAANDPLIEDSLQVVDHVLKVETPGGPCWHRYNHDGYGQRRDGGPRVNAGVGRAWPLLTGERGHYELADETLRIQTSSPFRLRWSDDNWQSFKEYESVSPGGEIHYADLQPSQRSGDRIEFTFWWREDDSWEQTNYSVRCCEGGCR